ncbi:MAG: phosphocholine cytidylyltransferase family protein [Lachnospiraceae bacterium]|nr:phosphocholine cytidylyltransferase family protein [Lachnospiraceae bacterium]
MQAIILAAGKGNRLRPYTDTIPKCMVKIKGKPLMFNALDRLAATGKIDEVIIICGYMADVIKEGVGSSYKGMDIVYIVNDQYETTNNVYSLYMVGHRIKTDCLLLECDLFYQQDIIDSIIDGEADCSILVSAFNSKTMNGTLITAENGNARELIIKAHQDENRDYSCAYKTVNIYKFKETFFNRKLMPALETYVKTGNLQSYYELVIGSLIYYRNDNIQIVIVDESRWYEIDDLEDYEIANQSDL